MEREEALKLIAPKADYYDSILANPSTVLVTQIAQDYGMSAKAFNKILKELGIQHKVGRQWILYGKYIAEGYVHSETQTISTPKGDKIAMLTKWTQKGRLFLYEKLKKHGILPLIERSTPANPVFINQ